MLNRLALVAAIFIGAHLSAAVAQVAEQVLYGSAARDFLIAAATTGDVAAQAAIEQAVLVQRLAVEADLGYDRLANNFIYACQGVAEPGQEVTTADETDATPKKSFLQTQVQSVDEFAINTSSWTGPDAGEPLPSLESTFKLHSRPGSRSKIYLDFDGHNTIGTAWNQNRASVLVTPPYSLDPDPAFSTADLQAILGIWRAVAEDFSMFDVDVTTEEPPELRNQQSYVPAVRVAIGGSSMDWFGGAAGGVAWVGSFGQPNWNVAYVFSRALGNTPKSVWEAASHEVGHTLGLNHDGDSSREYYSGHGRWAPIMGVGYSRPVTQWSRGEYVGANNKQDDIAIIRAKLGGSFAPFDGGSGLEGAVPLTVVASSGGASTAAVAGVLDSPGVADYYSFSSTAQGAVNIRVEVVPNWQGLGRANLDVIVKVYNSGGGEVITDGKGFPADPLGVNLQLPSLPPGQYKVAVLPTGSGDPVSSGYSSYASLGQYHLIVSFPGVSVVQNPAAAPPPNVQVVLPSPSAPPLPIPTVARADTVRMATVAYRRHSMASALVRVVDDVGNGLPNAVVTIRWGVREGAAVTLVGWPYISTATTSATGVAYMLSAPVPEPQMLSDAMFTVVGVAAPGLPWDGEVKSAYAAAQKPVSDSNNPPRTDADPLLLP